VTTASIVVTVVVVITPPSAGVAPATLFAKASAAHAVTVPTPVL
jgi:hypothetical protein